MVIEHKGVKISIRQGDERPEGVDKAVNTEPYTIDVDLEKIPDKLVEYILIIHFPMCFQ